MSNTFFIQSLLPVPDFPGYVIDIELGGGQNPHPTGNFLDLHSYKSSSNANQIWSFEPGPESGYFFINSAMVDSNGNPLAVDIHGNSSAAPLANQTLIDVYTRKSTSAKSGNGYKNQLWTVRSGPINVEDTNLEGFDVITGIFIQSLLQNADNQDMVIDVQGARAGTAPPNGATLDVERKTSGNQNQLWVLLANAGDSFSPSITITWPEGALRPPVSPDHFNIDCKGFFPGSQLILTYIFTPTPTASGNPVTNTANTVSLGNADFAGNLAAVIPTGALVVDEPGVLQGEVTCAFQFAQQWDVQNVTASFSAPWNGLNARS